MANSTSDTAHQDRISVCHQYDTEKMICTRDTASHVASIWGPVSNSHSHRAARRESKAFSRYW